MNTKQRPTFRWQTLTTLFAGRALLLVLAILLTQVLPAPVAAQAPLPEPPVQIIFASDRDTGVFQQSDIYIMNPDGTDVRRLTIGMAPAYAPELSPDHTRIAFYSAATGKDDIYVMNVDGLNIRNLTNTPDWREFHPVWSPDGTELAFSAIPPDGNWDVYVMNADGSNVRRLTTHPDFDFEPFWSPDGTRIAFSSRRDGDQEIFVMDPDGTNVVQLTYDSSIDGEPAWSPDGSQFAFTSLRAGDYDLFTMNADGSNQTNITNTPGSTPAGREGRPRWSPDGQWLVFHSVASPNWEVSVIRPNGAGRTNLTIASPADEWYPSWGVLQPPEPPNEPPVAAAGTSLDTNSQIELNGSLSTDPDGTIVSYSWQIAGEASPRTGQVVSIADLAPGEYTVELTVTDDDGDTATDTMLLGVPAGQVDTTPPARPNAQLNQNPPGTDDAVSGNPGDVEGLSTVQVFSDAGLTSPIGSTVANPDGSFAPVSIGNNTLDLVFVTATDAAGNQSLAQVLENDIIDPTVEGTSPTEGETGVRRNTKITFTFSEFMDTPTTTSAFSITPSVTGSTTVDGRRLTFSSDGLLPANTTFTVTVDGSAVDQAGNPLGGTGASLTFTTGSR